MIGAVAAALAATLSSDSATALHAERVAVAERAGSPSEARRSIAGDRARTAAHRAPRRPRFRYQAYLLPSSIAWPTHSSLFTTTSEGAGKARITSGEDVTLKSDLDDLDAVRQHFGLAVASLARTFVGRGAGLEYTLRYPNRVSNWS